MSCSCKLLKQNGFMPREIKHTKTCKYIPTEAEEQKIVIEYLELKGYKFTAIPNSTYTTSWKQKRHNTDMGLRSGLPDLFIILPNHILFLEMKRIKKSTVSKEQEEWIKAINGLKLKNISASVAYGADQAIQIIETIVCEKK